MLIIKSLMKVDNAKNMQDEKLSTTVFFFFTLFNSIKDIYRMLQKHIHQIYTHFIFNRLVFCNFTDLNYSIPFAPFESHTLYMYLFGSQENEKRINSTKYPES